MIKLYSTIPLNQGGEIPVIGLGTYCNPPKNRILKSLPVALEAGYRLIDTAYIYKNEHFIGKGLKKSKFPREKLFITTKIAKHAMKSGKIRETFHESLKRLKLDYVDMLLLHRPLSGVNQHSWGVLEDLQKEGLTKAIGVSNFLINHLEQLKETSTVIPAVNQIELHPFFYREKLVNYCRTHGIIIQSYSPIALGKKLGDPRLVDLAIQIGKSPAQVLIRWHLDHGFIPIPRSMNTEHVKANIDVFDFSLPNEVLSFMDGWNEDFMVISPDPDEPAIR